MLGQYAPLSFGFKAFLSNKSPGYRVSTRRAKTSCCFWVPCVVVWRGGRARERRCSCFWEQGQAVPVVKMQREDFCLMTRSEPMWVRMGNGNRSVLVALTTQESGAGSALKLFHAEKQTCVINYHKEPLIDCSLPCFPFKESQLLCSSAANSTL